MRGVTERSRRLVWLSPRALSIAEQLSALTGVGVPDLLELVLLELESALGDDGRDPAPPHEAPRQPPRTAARVIPIERARR